MKLFIWQGDGVLEDYTSGQIVALANTLEEANEVIIKDTSHATYPSDEPSEIVDLGDISVPIKVWITWGGG